jgi:hypothetical protein
MWSTEPHPNERWVWLKYNALEVCNSPANMCVCVDFRALLRKVDAAIVPRSNTEGSRPPNQKLLKRRHNAVTTRLHMLYEVFMGVKDQF